MRIVLIGDLHFYKLAVWPWELAGKRLWGQMNLWLNRRLTFKLSRMAAVVERVHEIKPDLLLFSGDLTTTALPAEFALARAGLKPLLDKYPAVIVPGNHDRHSFVSARRKLLERAFPDAVPPPGHFPHHRDLGSGLHLIAVDPTRANFLSDRGRVGARQLGEIERIIGSLPADARLIVLCHYTLGLPPSLPPEASRHKMIDQDELRAVLAAGGRDTLYLHGHVHTPFCWRLAGVPGGGNIVAINAGAPLMHDARWPNGQGFWEIRVEESWKPIHHSHEADGRWSAEPAGVPAQPGGAVTFT